MSFSVTHIAVEAKSYVHEVTKFTIHDVTAP